MQIVLIMLNNYQDYILDNIENLLRFNNNDIVVITDTKFNDKFEYLLNKITIINVESLIPNYRNDIGMDINTTFRNGFWKLTTYRFYALHRYMKQYDKEHVVHIENDVLIYKNINDICFHTKDKILLTLDSKKRCIPGIIVIPNYKLLEKCLSIFKENLNDMENWAYCFHYLPELIDTLPIFVKDKTTHERDIITRNFNNYNAIFDAAAIGQYLGGVDPRNQGGDTAGFVNETCIFNYSANKFIWKINDNNINVPFIIIETIEYPIINLHIHSKNLKRFMV